MAGRSHLGRQPCCASFSNLVLTCEVVYVQSKLLPLLHRKLVVLKWYFPNVPLVTHNILNLSIHFKEYKDGASVPFTCSDIHHDEQGSEGIRCVWLKAHCAEITVLKPLGDGSLVQWIVCVWVRTCTRVCVRDGVCVRVCACMHAYGCTVSSQQERPGFVSQLGPVCVEVAYPLWVCVGVLQVFYFFFHSPNMQVRLTGEFKFPINMNK